MGVNSRCLGMHWRMDGSDITVLNVSWGDIQDSYVKRVTFKTVYAMRGGLPPGLKAYFGTPCNSGKGTYCSEPTTPYRYMSCDSGPMSHEGVIESALG
ncbi:hypothetical protein WA026_020033 [Henosepilachna vigintioctopunctata]|uniref:Uncharacterized protein n=1 Tax=Henosepilachna vigintioctopunctata TaxID=420089 RepID=A0AAW1UVD4_9CUCU